MTKFSKVAVIPLVTAASLVSVSSAGAAVTWLTNGSRAFSSNNAGTARLIDTPTGGGTAIPIQCTSSTGSGTINASTVTNGFWGTAASLTPTFTGCTVTGVAGYTVLCTAADVEADTYTGGTSLPGYGGVTTGWVWNITCVISAGATRCSTITGFVPASYTNPSGATTAGVLKTRTAGQSLDIDRIRTGCVSVPDGRGQYGVISGTGVADLSYTTVAVGTSAPNIVAGP